MLQRKTLLQTKESVQKELEKVLKKTDTQMAEKVKLLDEKTMQFETMKTESDATVQELREKQAQFATVNERLLTTKEQLEKERDELRSSLNQKMQESQRIEESLRGSLLHTDKPKPATVDIETQTDTQTTEQPQLMNSLPLDEKYLSAAYASVGSEVEFLAAVHNTNPVQA